MQQQSSRHAAGQPGARQGPAAPAFPVIDLGPWAAGEPDAADATAAQFRTALETLGFFAVVNHGVTAEKFDTVFAEARRFHRLPLAEKLRLRFADSYAGYLPAAEYSIKTSTLNENDQPDLNEAFFVEREAPPPEADPAAARGYRCPNQWPAGLPGFRESLLDYYGTLERFAHSLLPLYGRRRRHRGAGCQWRSKKGPPRRCKKGPLGGCGLVPVVHGRAPRATRRALNRLTRRRAREGPVGPRGQAWAGWSVQLAVGV